MATKTQKLSLAQQRFMDAVRAAGSRGDRTPFTGGRGAGRTAAAWYRTAGSLKAMGLITLEREGDAYRAKLVPSKVAPGQLKPGQRINTSTGVRSVIRVVPRGETVSVFVSDMVGGPPMFETDITYAAASQVEVLP